MYNTDYSRKNDQAVAWIKKTGARGKRHAVEKILPTGYVTESFNGELMGIYFALLDAVSHGYVNVLIKNDNKGVIEVLTKKRHKPRKSSSKFIIYLIDNLIKNIKSVKFEWIRRTENGEADKLAGENS